MHIWNLSKKISLHITRNHQINRIHDLVMVGKHNQTKSFLDRSIVKQLTFFFEIFPLLKH